MVRVLAFAAVAFHAWGYPVGSGGSGSAGSGGSGSAGSGGSGSGAPVLKLIPGQLSTEVQIGEGNNALVWHPFPGFLSDAKGSWPAVVYPKDPPPAPSAESARYLVCSLHQGQLKVVEIVIFSKDGKVYAKQGTARVQDGISLFNGDLKEFANSEYPSMSPSYDLKVNDLRYEEASTVAGALVGVNVFLEIRVAYVENFCKNEPAQKALADAIAELTKVPGAKAKVEDIFTVFMPADQVASGDRQLRGSSLSDLTEAVSSRTGCRHWVHARCLGCCYSARSPRCHPQS